MLQDIFSIMDVEQVNDGWDYLHCEANFLCSLLRHSFAISEKFCKGSKILKKLTTDSQSRLSLYNP